MQDLKVASPATVSRCGMVFVDPEELKWMPYVKTWMQSISKKVSTARYSSPLPPSVSMLWLLWRLQIAVGEGLSSLRYMSLGPGLSSKSFWNHPGRSVCFSPLVLPVIWLCLPAYSLWFLPSQSDTSQTHSSQIQTQAISLSFPK